MLYFESKNDLKNIIPFLNSFIIYPKDSSQVNEIFSSIVYLYSLNKLDKLNYPFALIKRESPDFSVLCYDVNDSRGVEHTLSTLQDYKMAESELKKLPPYSELELDYYSPLNKLPKNEINKGLRNPSEHLIGQGYYGDSPEYEWAEIIKNTIYNKTTLLNKAHYEKFVTNELIVEDDSPVEILINVNKGLRYLEPYIKEYSAFSFDIKFDKIHIITKNTFVYNVRSENETIRFSRDEINL